MMSFFCWKELLRSAGRSTAPAASFQTFRHLGYYNRFIVYELNRRKLENMLEALNKITVVQKMKRVHKVLSNLKLQFGEEVKTCECVLCKKIREHEV